MTFQDILAALAVVLNGLPQALLALTYGFGAFPTALAFFAGTAGVLIFQQVAPISFQAESIVLAGTMGRDRNERLNIVFFAGILMAILGALGTLETITQAIGLSILNAMMAGVGIILAKTAVDMTKEAPLAGGVSMGVGLLTYFITQNLIYTVIVSVVASSIVWNVLCRNKDAHAGQVISLENEKFELLKFRLTPRLVRNIFAMCTLQIGGNIAYAGVTGTLAGQSVNTDFVTIYSGLGDAVSALFGGAPVETIISGTAVAPNPIISGILMMLIMAAILLSKTMPKIAKYIPSQCIAGFLFVIGAIVVFPDNAVTALSAEPVVAGVTTIVTACSDPFVGMIAGVLTRFMGGLFA